MEQDTMSTKELVARLERERDEARQIVRDIHWMAVRYADGRKSYAPGMCNDALKKAYDAGWLTFSSHGNRDPQYARDGMFSDEWVSIEARAEAAEARIAVLEEALLEAEKQLVYLERQSPATTPPVLALIRSALQVREPSNG